MVQENELDKIIRELICSIKPYGDWSKLFKPEEPQYNYYSYRTMWLEYVREKRHVRNLIK